MKRIIACFSCLILLISAVCGCYMIRRGPTIALINGYNIHFRDCPFVVSRKMHLNLGTPRELEEQNETYYQVETDILGVKSTISFYFLGGNQLAEVYMMMEMDDFEKVKEKYREYVALIESVYEKQAWLKKSDDVKYQGEYEIEMSFRDSGVTGVYYHITATASRLTMSTDYTW